MAVPFEIPHKISYLYIERCACKYFWYATPPPSSHAQTMIIFHGINCIHTGMVLVYSKCDHLYRFFLSLCPPCVYLTQAIPLMIIPVPEKYQTRTTRTPAFWGYPPPPHDYPYHWVILDPNSKEDKYSLLMHCIKIKSPAKFLLNEQYVFVGGNIYFLCVISCSFEEA